MILFRYDAKGALAAAADFSNGIHIQVTALEPVMRSRSHGFFFGLEPEPTFQICLFTALDKAFEAIEEKLL